MASAPLKVYEYDLHGVQTTGQLTEEQAERMGASPVGGAVAPAARASQYEADRQERKAEKNRRAVADAEKREAEARQSEEAATMDGAGLVSSKARRVSNKTTE